MGRRCVWLVGLMFLVLTAGALPAEASLIPGHLYLAQRLLPNLPAWLKDAVESNRNAYYLGSLGHDIGDWASYYVGSDAGAELHELKTGKLIVNMLRVYMSYANYSNSFMEKLSKKYLAFWLGWVTHWVTDAYIHTLVDKYGGNYKTGKSRHIQLELVESKHVCQKMNLLDISFEDDDELYLFLSEACAETFPEEKAYQKTYESFEKQLRGEYTPPLFITMLKQGLSKYMLSGWECIRESCRTGTDRCQYWAKTAWNWNNAAIVSNEVFNEVKNPLLFENFYMTQTGSAPGDTFTVDVKVNETGLYGKFLKEWDEVMQTAIDKASGIFGQFYDYLKAPRDHAKDFVKNFPDVDILIPEGTLARIDDKALDRYADKTLRGLPDNEIRSVYCEYEFKKGGRTLKKDVLRAKIDFETEVVMGGDTALVVEKKILYNSKKGTAKLALPVPDQEKDYSLQLKVSLGGPEPFTAPLVGGKPLFEGVEFIGDEFPALMVQRDYWDPGKSKIMREFSYYMRFDGKEKIRHGKETRWYDNGQTVEYVAFRRHGQFHGVMTRNWRNGQTFDTTTYVNGTKQGAYVSFWSDGKARSRGQFSKNRKSGLWSYHLSDGSLEAQGTYYGKFSTIIVGCAKSVTDIPDSADEGLNWECGNKFGTWTLPGGKEKAYQERGDLDDEIQREIWKRPKSGLESSLDSQEKSVLDEILKLETQLGKVLADDSRLEGQIRTLRKKLQELGEEHRKESERLNQPVRKRILAKEAKLEDL